MSQPKTSTPIEGKKDQRVSESSLLGSNSSSSGTSGKKTPESKSNSRNKMKSRDSNNDDEIVNLDQISYKINQQGLLTKKRGSQEIDLDLGLSPI